MSQKRLTASPQKTKQQIAHRESRPDSAHSFPGGLHPILQLQRIIGNRAVGRLIQAKLAVSHPGDPSEQEADHVAGQVTSMSATALTATAQRQMIPDEEKASVEREARHQEPPRATRLPEVAIRLQSAAGPARAIEALGLLRQPDPA